MAVAETDPYPLLPEVIIRVPDMSPLKLGNVWDVPDFCRLLTVDAVGRMCSNHPMMVVNGRILAVDYGRKNIGLAYCDEVGITIQPMPSLPNLGMKDFVNRLRGAVQSLEIRQLVLGMPLNMDGTQGDAFARMQQLMEILKAKLGIPLHGVDERLSTVEAAEIWKDLSRKQQKKYRTIDSLAAALILERYLKEN